MDAVALRARQAPLKQRYQDDPGSASTPVHAVGRPEGPGFSFTVETWAGPVRAGLHEATGGDGSDACSGDMLLEALVACAGVTMRSVAKAMGIVIRSGTMEATASFDARGTLAVSRDVPVGLNDIRIQADLDTDSGPDQLARLAELTERYCVVGQSLQGALTFDLRPWRPDDHR